MNLNLKMTVERSKRLSQFLSLVFITKSFRVLSQKNIYQEIICCLRFGTSLKEIPATPTKQDLGSC